MNTINQENLINNIEDRQPSDLVGLRIPLGKSVQQIALLFSGEQKDVAKGKQVFFNTLAVIAVHKCLKQFGLTSYLEIADCWDKVKRSIFNVADLTVVDSDNIIRIECFPVLPEQTEIEIPLDLLETRRGCLAVKFHQHFNYVEMLGFKLFENYVQADDDITISISELEPFETIFEYVKPCPQSIIGVSKDWKDPEEVNRKIILFANGEKLDTVYTLPVKAKVIDLSDDSRNCKIVLFATIENIAPNYQNLKFEIYNYQEEHNLINDLTLTILAEEGVVGDFNQKLIGGDYGYKTTFKKLEKGTKFTLIFASGNIQKANYFTTP